MATVENLDLTLAGGTCDALRATPEDGPGPWPPVLFVMDAVGLRPRIVEMVSTVADLGYAVLAPNIFYRMGRQPLIAPELFAPGRNDERVARMMELIKAYSPKDWDADGPQFLDALGSWSAAADRPVRVVGYCMGGRLGISLAAAEPERVAGAAGYHSAGLVTDAPDSLHKRLGTVRAPIYLGYADNDGGATPEQQEAFARAAADAGVQLTAEVYADAAHGYTMADLPSYDAEATAKHWDTLRDFFASLG